MDIVFDCALVRVEPDLPLSVGLALEFVESGMDIQLTARLP